MSENNSDLTARSAGSAHSAGSVGSMEPFNAKLLRPNRSRVIFQLPEQTDAPILATLEVKIPISTSFNPSQDTIFAWFIRTHTTIFDPRTGALTKIRQNPEKGMYKYKFVRDPKAKLHPKKDEIQYEINPAAFHTRDCRASTVIKRGTCTCDLDGEFISEVKQCYDDPRNGLKRNHS